ncbi:Ferritin light chain [Manis javanica]|nr:Ferritin light chain [Manis javanica]
MPTSRVGHHLFQDMQKPTQDEWGKALGAMGATMVPEENLSQALWVCMLWVVNVQTSNSGTSGGNHFLDEEVKLIKKMGEHLTRLLRLPGLQAGQGEHLFERLTLKPA